LCQNGIRDLIVLKICFSKIFEFVVRFWYGKERTAKAAPPAIKAEPNVVCRRYYVTKRASEFDVTSWEKLRDWFLKFVIQNLHNVPTRSNTW